MNKKISALSKPRQEEKDTVSNITRLIDYGSTIREIESLLAFICTETALFFKARFCLLRLSDDQGGLPVRASYGLDSYDETKLYLHRFEGIPGRVISKGSPSIVKNLSIFSPVKGIPYIFKPKTLLCAPLKKGEHIIGTIEFFDKIVKNTVVPFTDDDLPLINSLSLVSSLLINNTGQFPAEGRQQGRERDESIDSLFNVIYCGIVLLEKDFTIARANRYLESYLDCKIEEIIGKKCSSVPFLTEQAHVQSLAAISFKTGKPDTHIFQGTFRGQPLCTRTSIYPLHCRLGTVEKAIIFITNITEGMTYEEAILPLFKEYAETKEYLESIIENSADAIITMDREGNVTSWNKGAEIIYGFTHKEAFAGPLPTVADYMWERENQHFQEIKDTSTTRNREAIRIKKDGSLIEVSITESPILDTSGEVIGFCTISRDITEQKRVENALRRRNLELSRLFFINNAMRSTLEIDKVLKMTLAVVTMDDGLGYNRAIMFFVDKSESVLRGKLGIGPASYSEAYHIWHDLPKEAKTLEQMISDIMKNQDHHHREFDKFCQEIAIPLDRSTTLSLSAGAKKPFNVLDTSHDPSVDPELIERLSTKAFAVVPLVARNETIGLLWVDNLFNRRTISEEDFQFLIGFTDSIASTVENALLFQEVQLARTELERIFESISDMMYINDKNCTIIQINQAVVDRIGKPAEEIIGKKCYHIFHNEDTPWPQCNHMKTLETGQSHIEEVVDPVLGGTFVVTISPIFDSSGAITGTVHISRDVTEFHNMRNKLMTTERKAALGEMAAQVAHEIRNPLTPIGGFARRLEKKLDGDLKDYAKIIVQEVNRLEYILKHTLCFVRESQPDRNTVDINGLISDSASLLKNDIESKGNRLVQCLFPSPLMVNIESNRIKEALLNIISNANEATEKGTITISLAKEKRHAIISIADSGKGIKEENLKRIFDPFFTTRVSGIGLGLAITNRIIEEHKGTIVVDSVSGKGTSFTIHLPLKEEESNESACC